MPSSQRRTDAKTIAKSKEQACAGLKVKFDLNYYQISKKFKEEDNILMATRSTQDAIILVTYKCKELKDCIKAFDLRNACLIPSLKDKNRSIPSEGWDFVTHRHLLEMGCHPTSRTHYHGSRYRQFSTHVGIRI